MSSLGELRSAAAKPYAEWTDRERDAVREWFDDGLHLPEDSQQHLLLEYTEIEGEPDQESHTEFRDGLRWELQGYGPTSTSTPEDLRLFLTLAYVATWLKPHYANAGGRRAEAWANVLGTQLPDILEFRKWQPGQGSFIAFILKCVKYEEIRLWREAQREAERQEAEWQEAERREADRREAERAIKPTKGVKDAQIEAPPATKEFRAVYGRLNQALRRAFETQDPAVFFAHLEGDHLIEPPQECPAGLEGFELLFVNCVHLCRTDRERTLEAMPPRKRSVDLRNRQQALITLALGGPFSHAEFVIAMNISTRNNSEVRKFRAVRAFSRFVQSNGLLQADDIGEEGS